MADPTNSSEPNKETPNSSQNPTGTPPTGSEAAEVLRLKAELEKTTKAAEDTKTQLYKRIEDLTESVKKQSSELEAIRADKAKEEKDKQDAKTKEEKDKEIAESSSKDLILKLSKQIDALTAEKEDLKINLSKNFEKQLAAQNLARKRDKLLLQNPELSELADDLVPDPLADPDLSVTEEEIVAGVEKAKLKYAALTKQILETNKITPASMSTTGTPTSAVPATTTSGTATPKRTLEDLTKEFYEIKDTSDPRYAELRKQIMDYAA